MSSPLPLPFLIYCGDSPAALPYRLPYPSLNPKHWFHPNPGLCPKHWFHPNLVALHMTPAPCCQVTPPPPAHCCGPEPPSPLGPPTHPCRSTPRLQWQ